MTRLDFALIASLLVGSPACAAQTEQLEHDGRERSYLVCAPEPLPESPALVLVLHGGGGDASRVKGFSKFDALAQREGFVAVFPEAFEGHWNDGRGVQRYVSHREDVDDVGFVRQVIARVSERYRVDPTRVYVCGVSNGAMMTLRLARELEGLAAVATVIGSEPSAQAELGPPARALPLLMINGEEDTLVPWEGGDVRFGRRRMGQVISVPQTVALWVEANGCLPDPEVTRLPDLDSDDGTRVRRERYTPREPDGAEVVLYAVEGGGHTWPDPAARSGFFKEKLVGVTSHDLDATEVIWEFFQAHRLAGR